MHSNIYKNVCPCQYPCLYSSITSLCLGREFPVACICVIDGRDAAAPQCIIGKHKHRYGTSLQLARLNKHSDTSTCDCSIPSHPSVYSEHLPSPNISCTLSGESLNNLPILENTMNTVKMAILSLSVPNGKVLFWCSFTDAVLHSFGGTMLRDNTFLHSYFYRVSFFLNGWDELTVLDVCYHHRVCV